MSGNTNKAIAFNYFGGKFTWLYHDWHKVKLPVKKNNIRTGLIQEVIWMNYDTPDTQTLFMSL